MESNEDIRGYDLRVDHFQTRLNLLINESNLTPSTILYILKNTLRDVEDVYKQAIDIQYKKFCEETAKREKEEQQTETEEEQELVKKDN